MEALRAGNTRKASCQYAGISEDVFGRWLHKADFADAVRKAEADAEVRMVAQIAKAANDGTWTAAAWWLERRRPEDYARREKVDISIVRREAEQLAAEYGLDPEVILAEAEKIVAGTR